MTMLEYPRYSIIQYIYNGTVAVDLPYADTYTFYVQYNDESYNYYAVVVE